MSGLQTFANVFFSLSKILSKNRIFFTRSFFFRCIITKTRFGTCYEPSLLWSCIENKRWCMLINLWIQHMILIITTDGYFKNPEWTIFWWYFFLRNKKCLLLAATHTMCNKCGWVLKYARWCHDSVIGFLLMHVRVQMMWIFLDFQTNNLHLFVQRARILSWFIIIIINTSPSSSPK